MFEDHGCAIEDRYRCCSVLRSDEDREASEVGQAKAINDSRRLSLSLQTFMLDPIPYFYVACTLSRRTASPKEEEPARRMLHAWLFHFPSSRKDATLVGSLNPWWRLTCGNSSVTKNLVRSCSTCTSMPYE